MGDRVRHVKFGEGTVQDIREGGRDYEVTVDFDNAGVRKMFAAFARLVKVEPGQRILRLFRKIFNRN